MDALTDLMALIDLNSKLLPEGEYLKACNYMKDIYKSVPKPTSPEAFLPRVRTPRRILDSDSDDEDFELRPVVRDRNGELLDHLAGMSRRSREIKRIQSRLKVLKIKQRITAAIRKDAVRERAQQLGLRLREHTMEELRAKGHHIPDERSFYKSYMERQNLLTRNLIDDLTSDMRELEDANARDVPRWDELYLAVYGRPRIPTV
ncbi:hypothetical protein [Dishui Lake phycodnavirus 3]|nr:hypothetical protein [Dishui Lake phycodnavirus 3]